MKNSYQLAAVSLSGSDTTKREVFEAADMPVRVDLVTFYTAGTTAQKWVLGTQRGSGIDGIMAHVEIPHDGDAYGQFPPFDGISVTLMQGQTLYAQRLSGGTDAVTISVYGEPI